MDILSEWSLQFRHGCRKEIYFRKFCSSNSQRLWFRWNVRTFVPVPARLTINDPYTSDIDYEYPANAAQGQGFADLLTSVRAAFDQLAVSNGDSVPYQLTVSIRIE